MQTNLIAAQKLATNWWVKNRVADMQDEYNWVITNAGLAGVNLTNTVSYPNVGSTTNPYTANLTNMLPFQPAYSVVGNSLNLQPGPPVSWWFGSYGWIQETFNVAKAGSYNVAITGHGVNATNNWPTSYVYFGPKSGSMIVSNATDSTYNFTFTMPAGVWDLAIVASRCVIDNIQITRQ